MGWPVDGTGRRPRLIVWHDLAAAGDGRRDRPQPGAPPGIARRFWSARSSGRSGAWPGAPAPRRTCCSRRSTPGADAFVSGEIAERTTHLAREAGVVCFAAGHHATERYGVQALGEHVAERLRLEHRFVDDDNPV